MLLRGFWGKNIVFGGEYDRGIDKGDYSNISPRLGFAYRVTDKLVMRGGIAKICSPSNTAGSTVSGGGPAGNTAIAPLVATIDAIYPATTIVDPFPAGFNDPKFDQDGLLTLVGQPIVAGAANEVAYTPYMWQWDYGFEYQLGDLPDLSLACAGSRGRRLTCTIFNCGEQIAEKDFTSFRERVFETVPNPFFGIIPDPTSAPSREQVQLGQLLKQNPQFTSRVASIPPWQGPTGNEFQSNFESLQIRNRVEERPIDHSVNQNPVLVRIDQRDSDMLPLEVKGRRGEDPCRVSERSAARQRFGGSCCPKVPTCPLERGSSTVPEHGLA